ncbi:hypothetical protein FA15DRAFT_101743 [Coprinopsis marcescibilis]|uniref:Uncharacterized protein n=1 Tax=Coprinopsis marcescibilis TaxID=230819 RepID=A0A5C3KL36_COPMA|nr:hypothetical protein FA15DRAFT_101743 [Coprinopsis marcescibilis]
MLYDPVGRISRCNSLVAGVSVSCHAGVSNARRRIKRQRTEDEPDENEDENDEGQSSLPLSSTRPSISHQSPSTLSSLSTSPPSITSTTLANNTRASAEGPAGANVVSATPNTTSNEPDQTPTITRNQAHAHSLAGLGKGGIIGASLGSVIIFALIIMLITSYHTRKRRARKQPRRSATTASFFRTRSDHRGGGSLPRPESPVANVAQASNNTSGVLEVDDSRPPSPLYPPPGLLPNPHDSTPYGPEEDPLGFPAPNVPSTTGLGEEHAVVGQHMVVKLPHIVITQPNGSQSSQTQTSYDPPPYSIT